MARLTDTIGLYRIISLESFLQLLLCKEERYVNPFSWDDTYEGCGLRYINDDNKVNCFLSNLFRQYENEPNQGNRVLFVFAKAESVSNFCFGQCWSLDKDSDAIWRI